MKKLTVVLWILTLAVLCCACAQSPLAPAPTEPETQLHTVAPKDEKTDEINWAYLDEGVEVVDEKKTPVLSYADFECFALVGEGDDAYIIFRFTDEAAAMLSVDEGEYTVEKNGEALGALSKLSDDTATLITDADYTGLCAIADTLRGF